MRRFFTIICSVFIGLSLGHMIYNPETVSVWTYATIVINTISVVLNGSD
jgi:hypothetical protein